MLKESMMKKSDPVGLGGLIQSGPVLFTVKSLYLWIDSDRESVLNSLVLFYFEEILRRDYFLPNTQNTSQKAKI